MKFDEYEKELLELDEKGLIKSEVPSVEEQKVLKEAAKNTLQKDKRINIRISNRDLLSLKRKANRYGMPYQALISSVLHRFASGDIQIDPVAGDNVTR